MYDVIVIGSGPAGSLAAMKCAEEGLDVLLLEKSPLPRDKVCSGMIMGVMAQELIHQEFGDIPDTVLTNPSHLSGFMLYVPDTEPKALEYKMPYVWRCDLDYWMTQQAISAGAKIREGTKVVSVDGNGGHCVVVLRNERIESRFIIGADGANSTIRKSIWPELNTVYRTSYRECYRGELALDRNYFHWFAPLSGIRPRFSICHKGEFFIRGGSLKQLGNESGQILSRHGFTGQEKPFWKDGCISGASLKSGFDTDSFIPVKGNIILVGDAALLQMPVSWDGIGMALKSALLAAHSITESIATGRDAGEFYLPGFATLQDIIKNLNSLNRKIEETGTQGGKALASAWADGMKFALSIS